MKTAILGAGPAGASLALLLAEAGAPPLLFDGSHPREKPCGAGLPADVVRSWSVFRRFPGQRPFNGPRLYTTRKGRTFGLEGGASRHPMVYVSRARMDAYLADRARRAGAEWIPGHVRRVSRHGAAWRIETRSGQEYSADFIVGADGPNSLMHAFLDAPFPNQDKALAVGRRFPGLELDFIHTVHLAPGLFGFVLPGCGFSQAMVGARGGARVSRFVLNAFLDKMGLPRDQGALFGGVQPLAADASFFRPLRSGPGFLLIGDAAGFSNPLNGEGLRTAFDSAFAAAAALLDERPREYESRWRAAFGKELEQATDASRRTPPEWMVEAGAVFMGRSPSLAWLAHTLARGPGREGWGLGEVLKRASRAPWELAAGKGLSLRERG